MLISFGDLISLADEDRFFADARVAKLQVNCLGVMAKRSNWFPAANLVRALGPILERTAGFARRVTYGGSMGGYAALKFRGGSARRT